MQSNGWCTLWDNYWPSGAGVTLLSEGLVNNDFDETATACPSEFKSSSKFLFLPIPIDMGVNLMAVTCCPNEPQVDMVTHTITLENSKLTCHFFFKFMSSWCNMMTWPNS